jgi:hypothetical protein
MTILLSTLAVTGVAFAAFCVWLTVRIVNRRERWAIRTAILLALYFSWFVLSMAGASENTSWEHNPFGGPFIIFKEANRCFSDLTVATVVSALILVPSVHWAFTGKNSSAIVAAVMVALSIGLSLFAAISASC